MSEQPRSTAAESPVAPDQVESVASELTIDQLQRVAGGVLGVMNGQDIEAFRAAPRSTDANGTPTDSTGVRPK